MTIIYQYRVATTSLGGFLKLLRAWRGSVYKLLYKELIIFLALYGSVSLLYRLGMSDSQKRMFESVVTQLHEVTSAIPLSFVLGFYVTIIIRRWWQQFTNVPWPDRTLFILSTYLRGNDDKARMTRRTVARYMLFGFIIIMRAVSVAVMKRFPTLDHIVEAGFINNEEKVQYENVQCQYLKFWVPLLWANDLLVTAREDGRIKTDFGLRMVIEQLSDFRDKCSLCFVYDWITVPLVYTQVVTFAVHSYFAACLVGQQYLDPSQQHDGFDTDFYLPGLTILQFLFYMGWLKVAEQMINPFGEDDDDYDINWLLDRHTAVAFSLVDHCHGTHPPLTRDQFWNDVSPDVPYTESSISSIRPNFLGSTFNIARPSMDMERMIMPDHEEILAHNWPRLRKRSRGSSSGSLLSVFRHIRSHGNGEQPRESLTPSTGRSHDRFMSVPNAKSSKYLLVPGQDSNHGFDWSGRERSNTDCNERHLEDRVRKLSLPFSLTLSSKQNSDSCKQLLTPTPSPRLQRFQVEPVSQDLEEGSDHQGGKGRRSGYSNISLANGDKVSKIPDLSAIEEGNTITSIAQMAMITPPAQDDVYDDDDSSNDGSGSGDGDDGDGSDSGPSLGTVAAATTIIIDNNNNSNNNHHLSESANHHNIDSINNISTTHKNDKSTDLHSSSNNIDQ